MRGITLDNTKLVSVIIPTYNREKTIVDSINSVLKQSYENIEVLVIDDGSTDNTRLMIDNIRDYRVKYFYQKNAGACSARNYGINLSKGYYIAFQDSDDIWMQNKIEEQIKLLEKTHSDICACSMSVYDNGIYIKDIPDSSHSSIDFNTLFAENFISTQMLLYKSDALRNFKFDIGLPRLQDWDFVLNLLLNDFKFCFVNKNLVKQYISSDSISRNKDALVDAFSIIENKYSCINTSNKSYSRFYYNYANALHDAGLFKDAAIRYWFSFIKYPNYKAFFKSIITYVSSFIK